MVLYLLAEPRYALHESGALSIVALLFLGSLILAIVSSVRFGRTRRELRWSIVLILLLASGPFWGDAFDLQPNVHGLSIFMWLLYGLVASILVVYLIGATGWHALRARSAGKSK
jgi:hypothetical protein